MASNLVAIGLQPVNRQWILDLDGFRLVSGIHRPSDLCQSPPPSLVVFRVSPGAQPPELPHGFLQTASLCLAVTGVRTVRCAEIRGALGIPGQNSDASGSF